MIIEDRGDDLPVSAMPNDGTYPTGTTQWEKRNIALKSPSGNRICASSVANVPLFARTPSSAPRSMIPNTWKMHRQTFKSMDAKGFKEFPGYEVHRSGCSGRLHRLRHVRRSLPRQRQEPTPNAKPSTWRPSRRCASRKRKLGLLPSICPISTAARFEPNKVKNSQLLQPLFEFSGACAGCGETPYVKLLSQFFGDRIVIANATGCSSIYGGNLPTTPWAVNEEGRGPAWSNSLFEDNAEFGLGMRLTIEKQTEYASELVDSPGRQDRRRTGQMTILERRPIRRSRHQRPARARRSAERQTGWHADDPQASNLLSLADMLVQERRVDRRW